METNDILQIKHIMTYQGQEMINVFFYVLDLSSATSLEPFVFLDELSDYWEASAGLVMSPNASSVRITVDNLTNGLEFSEFNTGWAGTAVGTDSPAFESFGVRLSRDSKITRNGSKRMGGLVEEFSSGSNVTIGGAQLQGVLDYCSSLIFLPDVDGAGLDVTLLQKIIGRTLNAQGKYELDLTKVNNIVGVSLNPTLTTQRTRKV